MSDHYRTLGLQPTASKSDIKNAYFRLAHRYHPDHHAKADAAGRAAAAAWFRRAKDAYEVLSDDRRRAEYDRTIRSSSYSSASSSMHGNRQHGQYGGGATSSSSSGHGNRQHGQYGSGASSRSSGGGSSNSTETDSDWRERARIRRDGGGTYSSSSGSGNRQGQSGGASSSSSGSGNRQGQGQYGGATSSSSGGDTCSSTESGSEWIFDRARARGQGGTSSSTASGHGGSSGRRPPPLVPRPMVALLACCAGVIGGSALLWSVYKRPARKQES